MRTAHAAAACCYCLQDASCTLCTPVVKSYLRPRRGGAPASTPNIFDVMTVRGGQGGGQGVVPLLLANEDNTKTVPQTLITMHDEPLVIPHLKLFSNTVPSNRTVLRRSW